MTLLLRIAMWLLLVGIVLAVLTPIGPRPHVVDPTVAGFIAFAILGIAAGAGYRGHFALVLGLMVATAGMVEFLPLIALARDGLIPDAIIKVLGGVIGVVLGHVIATMLAAQPINHQ